MAGKSKTTMNYPLSSLPQYHQSTTTTEMERKSIEYCFMVQNDPHLSQTVSNAVEHSLHCLSSQKRRWGFGVAHPFTLMGRWENTPLSYQISEQLGIRFNDPGDPKMYSSLFHQFNISNCPKQLDCDSHCRVSTVCLSLKPAKCHDLRTCSADAAKAHCVKNYQAKYGRTRSKYDPTGFLPSLQPVYDKLRIPLVRWYAGDGFEMSPNYFIPCFHWSLSAPHATGLCVLPLMPIYYTSLWQVISVHATTWGPAKAKLTAIGPSLLIAMNSARQKAKLSPGRRSCSFASVTQTYIRITRWYRCPLTASDDFPYVFESWGWRHFWLVSHLVHWRACMLHGVHTLRNGAHFWHACQHPSLDRVCSTIFSQTSAAILEWMPRYLFYEKIFPFWREAHWGTLLCYCVMQT